MNIHLGTDNNEDENQLGEISVEQQEDSETPSIQKGNTRFKILVFAEFFGYFLLSAFFGPLTYFFLKFIRQGAVLARNLNVFGGSQEIARTVIWMMKIYCYSITLVFYFESNPFQIDNTSQFWLLIYTDISLAVLYGAYYSSFTAEEIKKFKTEVYDPGNNIFDKLVMMIQQGRAKILDRKFVGNAFLETDLKNFFFIYPKSELFNIPKGLETLPIEKVAPQLSKGGEDIFAISGQSFAAHILDVEGYRSFDVKIKIIKFISRLLVFIRVVLPVINNIYKILVKTGVFTNLGGFGVYLIQQAFYSLLIFRFVAVYDVIFLGLLLYIKKYRVLNCLWKIAALKPQKDMKKIPKIWTTVPHNAFAWLSMRRILADINKQVFIIIDTNMSFVLVYAILIILGYFMQKMKFMRIFLAPAQNFLSTNPSLLIVIALTIVVVIVVICVDLTIGILINWLFDMERGQWMLHQQVIGKIGIKYELFLDKSYNQEADKNDSHYEKIKEIKELLGKGYEQRIYVYLRKLRNAIQLVIDGIKAEENYNPHTVLGIATNNYFLIIASALISAIGMTSLFEIFVSISNQATV